MTPPQAGLLHGEFSALVRDTGRLPLAWAGSTSAMDYLNLGDALSPVMVALCTGLTPERVPSRSLACRMAAVGTIGHGIEGGRAWIWGTGSSNWRNPSAPRADRIEYRPTANTALILCATRGPVSEALMAPGAVARSGVYGDPVWLLPRFYRPELPKRWDLGVILHLSELTDRQSEAHPNPKYLRYVVPEEFRGSVRLINTVTSIDLPAMQAKLDEILSCRRLVSTSLHGMVFAESYGIPCLYFSPREAETGLLTVALDPNEEIDLRIVDLYQGLGRDRLAVYANARKRPTDWAALIDAIDRAWQPVTLDGDRLIDALPLEPAPLEPPATGTVFDHPAIRDIRFQHDIGELVGRDRERTAHLLPPLVHNVQERFAAKVASAGAVPLSWVAPTLIKPYPNLGDALSPLIVSTIAGLPIEATDFDSPTERLVAVGTVGHGQRNGKVHFWGTGFDLSKPYAIPADTEIVAHGLRGPLSAEALRDAGVSVPAVHGDPVWFLPKILPRAAAAATIDLGVVVHITEVSAARPDADVLATYLRYRIPEAWRNRVRIINTFTELSADALLRKVDEMLMCRRIASTSFHGLVIADAYGIPNVWFGPAIGGPMLVDPRDTMVKVDHRVRDFYAGTGKERLAVYCQQRERLTDWSELIRWIDRAWTPITYDAGPFFDAFPVGKAVSLEDTTWRIGGRNLLSTMPIVDPWRLPLS